MAGNRRDLSVLCHHQRHQSCRRAACTGVVLSDKAHAFGLRQIGVERHDRDTLIGNLVELFADNRVIRRCDGQTMNAHLHQFVEVQHFLYGVH